MTTCPPVHSHADHLACRYGGAYYHSIIRSLWMHQLAAWGRAPRAQEEAERA